MQRNADGPAGLLCGSCMRLDKPAKGPRRLTANAVAATVRPLMSMPASRPDTAQHRAGSHILICGASGNLGGHTARQLASPGTSLSLWGRDAARLEAVAAACRQAGAAVSVRSVDLTDIAAALAAVREEDDLAAFDSVFFCSGSGDTREAGRVFESAAQITRLALLNYAAPAALAAELGERMAARRAGRIAIVGTAAATHPLPFAAGYASSKCGLAQFAEALRIAVRPYGVTVTLVTPGFFAATTAGSHAYVRPGEIAPELVAQRMIKAVARGQSELVTPGIFLFLRWLGQALPRPLRDFVMLRLPSP